MKTGMRSFSLALAVVFCVAAFAPAANADSRGALRSVRGISSGRSAARPGTRGLQGLGGMLNSGRRHSSGNGARALQGLGNLFELGRRYGDSRHGDWRGAYDNWRDRYGDRYGSRYDDRYRSDKAYADAMRDAAIANAVVGVVGIIADAATSPPYRVYQQRYIEPAPQYVPAPRPAPEYRVERVLVQEGRHEEYQVWVPDTYDARTGEMIKGHYVIRQRYVPEVWQERYVRIR